MGAFAYHTYLEVNGAALFTVVLLPAKEGRFPTVICRSPYVKAFACQSEQAVTAHYLEAYAAYLRRGYAVVVQHCRGQGKSTGAFVPYLCEREDGLCLRAWIREQSFYNGALFLVGASYGASLHYATAPFEPDVRGAVFEVQDQCRYRLWYRNGQMRRGHANWHFGLYKAKCGLAKSFDVTSFSELPLAGLSSRALGEVAEDFEEMLLAERPDDPFWQTPLGGCDTDRAVDGADIPMLFTTGYNDFYIGGVFAMWRGMQAQTREKCAMLVSPYNHGDTYHKERGLPFLGGTRREQFGDCYPLDWLDHITKGTPLPYQKGVITYYRCFEDGWRSDYDASPTKKLTLPLGKGTRSFCYDPRAARGFLEEGTLEGPQAESDDLVCVETEPLSHDVFVKGRMQAVLCVSSDAPDTSFYVRVSLKQGERYYVLRHDITSLGYQLGDYTPNGVVFLQFSFDEHAFLLKKGERLRIELAATDQNTYVCHTNQKGPYSLQETARVARSTVYLDRSELILPVEEET